MSLPDHWLSFSFIEALNIQKPLRNGYSGARFPLRLAKTVDLAGRGGGPIVDQQEQHDAGDDPWQLREVVDARDAEADHCEVPAARSEAEPWGLGGQRGETEAAGLQSRAVGGAPGSAVQGSLLRRLGQEGQ